MQAINSGQLPDLIVDANHTIEYLKYAATRELFNTRGQKKGTTDRLSAVRVYNNTGICACANILRAQVIS